MDLETLAKHVTPETAKAFVSAARHVIDALLIEGEEIRQTQTPGVQDYNSAELPRTTPPGGWISHEELRETSRRLAEAIAAEKWLDGVVFAVRCLKLGA